MTVPVSNITRAATQSAYERMRAYLTREGAAQAIDENGDCAYVCEIDGKTQKCAVGCLLSPDTLGAVGNIVASVKNLLQYHFDAVEADLAGIDEEFLSFAQDLHDTPVNWLDDGFDVVVLDDLAREFGLEVVSA